MLARLRMDGFLIASVAFFDVAVPDDAAVLHQCNFVAESPRQLLRMRSQNENSGAMNEGLKALIGPFEECGVACTNSFVQQQDVGFDTGGHRESKSRTHSFRIGSNWKIEKLAKLRKVGDVIHFPHD